jgi:hypothetical protein
MILASLFFCINTDLLSSFSPKLQIKVGCDEIQVASLAEEEEIQSGHRDLFQQILVSVNVTALLRMMGKAIQEMGFRPLPSAALSLWWRVTTGTSGLEIDICIPLKPDCPAGYICCDC